MCHVYQWTRKYICNVYTDMQAVSVQQHKTQLQQTELRLICELNTCKHFLTFRCNHTTTQRHTQTQTHTNIQ